MSHSATLSKPCVTQAVFDDLVHYYKYSTTAYSVIGPRANGQAIITKLYEFFSDTHGYIVCDDKRKEIVVAFRGSVSLANWITDALIKLVDYDCPGVSVPEGTMVHFGVQDAWKKVAKTAQSAVAEQLRLHSDYSLVTTGHSLGGALASIAAVTLKVLHPTVQVRMYTYGQMRVGNAVYAALANQLMGAGIYRVVHASDGAPTAFSRDKGYRHHGIEYWSIDPHSAETTYICDPGNGDEDPEGSMSVSKQKLIDVAHTWYFGILYTTPFL